MLSWLPPALSTYAKDIDRVFYLIYYLTGAVLLLVTVLMVVFLWQYRYQEGRRALYTHGNAALELTWTIIPTIVFLGIFFISKSTWSDIKATVPPEDVQVRLVAKQFAWDFHYPGPDGAFDTGDDKVISGELHVPVDKVVKLNLQAQDVIHSFFVPVFRLKQDLLPGRTIPAWFQATATGRYEIPCAELCGPGHSGMKGWVTVHSAADYQAWVSKQWPSS